MREVVEVAVVTGPPCLGEEHVTPSQDDVEVYLATRKL